MSNWISSFMGTDGDAGSGDMSASRNDLGLEGEYYGDIGNLGKYDAGQYKAYDPSRVNALQQEANYWGNLAKNGFTADQQNMLLGGMGNPQYQANQEMSAGRLQDQMRGIDTGGGSSNSVTAGRDANINDNAMNAYMRARAQLGQMQMQMQQNAYANQAQAYSQIVNPYQEGAYKGLETAAQGYGGLANSYAGLAEYDNNLEKANSPFSQLQGIGQIAGAVQGFGSFLPSMGRLASLSRRGNKDDDIDYSHDFDYDEDFDDANADDEAAAVAADEDNPANPYH
jgi:hypothetical protein